MLNASTYQVFPISSKNVRYHPLIQNPTLEGNPSPFPMSPTSQACYNLVYLELAACRLTTLPENCSALIPNVRVLNLNYNFLGTSDVSSALSGLTRLRKLTIVGNRMAGTKSLIQMLGGMGENIEMLDFR